MPDTLSKLYYHYVCAVKYRNALIQPDFEDLLYKYISGITKNLNQSLIQINGMPDHIHLLVRLKPAMSPSEFIMKIKSNSSKWINEMRFINDRFNWQYGGAIFSVSYGHVERVSRYIQNQKAHHLSKSLREEYNHMLIDHSVEFDPKFLPDFFD